MASKRKTLCINEKVSLIRAIEMGETKSNVGRRFGLSPSSVSTIWKNRGKILQAKVEGNFFKKLKKPKFEGLDRAMIAWFYRQRESNTHISGPLIKAKAEEIAKELGLTNFKSSEGWLGKFKKRHHIKYGNNDTVLHKSKIKVKSEESLQLDPGENSSSSEKEIEQSPPENSIFFPSFPIPKVESSSREETNFLDQSSVESSISQKNFTQPKPSQTNCSTLASLWIEKLERLNPVQKLFAEKAINDILFEAELGNLRRNSVKINEPPVAESKFCIVSSPSEQPTPSSSYLGYICNNDNNTDN